MVQIYSIHGDGTLILCLGVDIQRVDVGGDVVGAAGGGPQPRLD